MITLNSKTEQTANLYARIKRLEESNDFLKKQLIEVCKASRFILDELTVTNLRLADLEIRRGIL